MKRFYIFREFDSELLDKVPELYECVGTTDTVEVFINSPGGSTDVLKTFLDAFKHLKKNGVTVSTFVTGRAASAASMLAVAGSPGHRYISETASHYVHYGTVKSKSHNPVELKDEFEDSVRAFKFVEEHYYEFASGLDVKNAGEYFTADESVHWGLADEVL